jgi:hypothetical protein
MVEQEREPAAPDGTSAAWWAVLPVRSPEERGRGEQSEASGAS